MLLLAITWMVAACGGSPPAGLMFEAQDPPETTVTTPATPDAAMPPTTVADLLNLSETPTDGLPETFPMEILPPGLLSSEYIRAGSGEKVELRSSGDYEEIVEFYTELLGDPALTGMEDGVTKTFWLYIPSGPLGERLQTMLGVFDMDPVLIRVTGLF